MNRLFINSIFVENPEGSQSYISELPVVKNIISMGGIQFCCPVTFFIGENGIGKSTLLEALAVSCGFNAEGGSKNFNFATRSTESDLCKYLKVTKKAYEKDGYFLRAESFYNVASNIEDLDKIPASSAKIVESYGGNSLHKQSHGESFMSLVCNRFGENGLYILDEPEAALSPLRQMSLIAEIQRLVKNGSQFIISTHSPILMSFPNAEIYEIKEDGIFLTPYKETEHYMLTKQFLDNPEVMIKHLINTNLP